MVTHFAQKEDGLNMAKKPLDPRQMPMFIPESVWKTPVELPNLLNEPVLAFDTETKDPDLNTLGPSWFRGGGHIVGFSFAWNGGSIYVPIRHEGGDNFHDVEAALSWLRHLLKNYKGILILTNGSYDLGWCRMENIHVNPEATLWDVQMVEALLDEHRQRYNLMSLLKTYGIPPKDEALLNNAAATFGVDPKKGLYALPARFVGAYGERDVVGPLEIYRKQKPLVTAQGLDRVVKLEHDLMPMLLEMRFRGVPVDVKKAELLLNQFMSESDGFVQQIKHLTGYAPDIWAPDSCAVALDKANIRFNRTANGKASITDEWMATFPEDSVPNLINRARKSYKAGNTFCKGLVIDHADAAGRIHCEFHPLRSDDGGTVSGRFSSSNPNLQQVPARDPRMNTLIRGLFLPEEGEQWAACDYSQQEPRLTIHYAAERGCTRAEEVVKIYNENPSMSYHNLVAEWIFGKDFTPKQYKQAKNINLGLAYGMGGAKLCKQLGYPTKTATYNGKEWEVAGEEGQALLDKYHKEVPFIRELTKQYGEVARDIGEIRTLSGRLCRFASYEPLRGGRALPYSDAATTYGPHNIRRAFTHTALNRKIQGGSADMMKIAMRNMWREGIVPFVTVHDEVGLSVKNKEEAKKVMEIMATAVKLRVPLKVDCDLGPSWGEAKPMTEDDL
jgi:DNA polymerase I-like protein with 3'-5' exonuclease and polymerase domains